MADTWIKAKHDIGITNVGSDGTGTDVIGLMLARKKEVPIYAVHDAKLLVDQIATAIPGPEYTNPEEELLLGQSDFRSGFGQEVYDTSTPRRYYSSIGADLRFKGMAVAGPISTALANPTPPALTDGGLETWTDVNNLTNWTNDLSAGCSVTREASTIHGGTYSARLFSDQAGDHAYIYQSLGATTGLLEVKVWVYASQANGARIAIKETAAFTYSSYHTGVAGWEQLTVRRSCTGGVTSVYCMSESAGGGITAFFDDAACTTVDTDAIVCMAEFNDNLYYAKGSTLCKLNISTGNTSTWVGEFPANITDLEPFTDDRLYIALGTSNAYWYMSTAEAFTESTEAVTDFQFFKTVHSATPTLWGNDGANTIRSNTNPINGGAGWSGQTTVGSSYYSITGLNTKSGALYIMKEDMPYYLNSAGAVQNDLAPELASLTSSTSGKNTKVYKNNLYIPCGAQGLLESGTANSFISPSAYATNLSDFAGQVMALAYDEEYLFAAVDNSTKIEILAGHYETIDGETSWVWHPIHELTLTGCEMMFVSSIYKKRLYISSTTGSESFYYIDLFKGYGNITADDNRSFKTGSYFITPYLHGQFKSTQKGWIKLTVTLGHAYDADIYISGAYEKIGDTSWTSIGNFDGTSANRLESIYIPAAGSNNPISTMMRFKFTFVTDDTAKTPIMLNYTVKAVLYPEIKNLIACTVNASNEVVTKNGQIAKFDKATIETTLTNALNATWPVSIRDIDGNTKTVKFLPLPRNTPRYTTVKSETGREDERWYNLLMMIVSLS